MTDEEIVALWRQHKEVMGFAHALLAAERERLAQPADANPDPLHLSRILHELAGAASLCWTPHPSGVFDSQEAIKHVESAIAEIRDRLAQQVQEPVAWVDESAIRWLADRKGKTSAHCTTQLSAARSCEQSMPIYTAPPQPEQGQG